MPSLRCVEVGFAVDLCRAFDRQTPFALVQCGAGRRAAGRILAYTFCAERSSSEAVGAVGVVVAWGHDEATRPRVQWTSDNGDEI
jgi:hypothetical protein